MDIRPLTPLRGVLGSVREWLRATFLPAWPTDNDMRAITRVFDMASGAEVFRHDVAGPCRADLAPDGRSLVLFQDDGTAGRNPTISCYDIPERRPWLSIAGMPLALGVLVIGTGAAWRRLWSKKGRQGDGEKGRMGANGAS